jgi:hypothetical protein
MLIELENGDWVDPRAVTAIAVEFPIDEDHAEYRNNVVAIYSGLGRITINCDTVKDAVDTAHRIAGQINAAREAR